MTELLAQYMPWGLSIAALAKTYWVGDKKRWVWAYAFVVQGFWWIWIWAADQWGFAPMGAVQLWLCIRNHRKWNEEEL